MLRCAIQHFDICHCGFVNLQLSFYNLEKTNAQKTIVSHYYMCNVKCTITFLCNVQRYTFVMKGSNKLIYQQF